MYYPETPQQKILRTINDGRQKIFKNVLKPGKLDEPLLSINGYPLLFPNTINVLQGQTGTHKSRFAEHIVSQIIKKPGTDDLIGLKVNRSNLFCSYVDTERNLGSQLAISTRNIALNSGYTPEEIIEHKYFDIISLIPFERDKRHEALSLYLENIRKKHNGPIFCVLDIVSDMITDFNNSFETLKFFDLLNTYINDYNTSFLCIIHENPGNSMETKARGHLGTELLNKSSTAISINFKERSKDQEVLIVQFLKNRLAHKGSPVYLKYSEEMNCLVKAEACEIDQAKYSGNKVDLNKVCKYVIDYIKKPIPKQELIEILKDKFSCSDKTIINYLNMMLEGEVINNLGYSLEKLPKEGVKVIYQIKKYSG
jgi:hypothetical protein